MAADSSASLEERDNEGEQRPRQRLDSLPLSSRLCIPAQACIVLAVISVIYRNALFCSEDDRPGYGRCFVMSLSLGVQPDLRGKHVILMTSFPQFRLYRDVAVFCEFYFIVTSGIKSASFHLSTPTDWRRSLIRHLSLCRSSRIR
jgi:hypothetical protein